MNYLRHKFFSLDEGDIMFMVLPKKDDWTVKIFIETAKECRGTEIGHFDCEFLPKAMLEVLTSDMALASILDKDYKFIDNFSDLQQEEIDNKHSFLHEMNRKTKERNDRH